MARKELPHFTCSLCGEEITGDPIEVDGEKYCIACFQRANPGHPVGGTCEDCRWGWDRMPDQSIRCHVAPPVYTGVPDAEWDFPKVREDNRCAQYTPKNPHEA